jgi:hypothetical protein
MPRQSTTTAMMVISKSTKAPISIHSFDMRHFYLLSLLAESVEMAAATAAGLSAREKGCSS